MERVAVLEADVDACLVDGRAQSGHVNKAQSARAGAGVGQRVVDQQDVQRNLGLVANDDERRVAIGQRDRFAIDDAAVVENGGIVGPRAAGDSDVVRAIAIGPVSYTHLDVYKRQPRTPR